MTLIFINFHLDTKPLLVYHILLRINFLVIHFALNIDQIDGFLSYKVNIMTDSYVIHHKLTLAVVE